MDDLLSDFLTETNESLAELDVALITLERTPDDAETLGFIFRLVHTIKGTCGFLGLPRLERVAHAGENVLGKLRDRSLTVTPEIVTQVLAGIDQIKAIVTALGETGAEPPGDDVELIAALNAAAANEAPAAKKAARHPHRSPTRKPSRPPHPSKQLQPQSQPPQSQPPQSQPLLPQRPRRLPLPRQLRLLPTSTRRRRPRRRLRPRPTRPPTRRPSASPSMCWKT